MPSRSRSASRMPGAGVNSSTFVSAAASSGWCSVLKRTPFPDRRKPMGWMVKDESNAPQTEPEPQAEATAASGKQRRRSSPNPHRKTTQPAGLIQQSSSWLSIPQGRFLDGAMSLNGPTCAVPDRSEIGSYFGGLQTRCLIELHPGVLRQTQPHQTPSVSSTARVFGTSWVRSKSVFPSAAITAKKGSAERTSSSKHSKA